MTFMLYMAVSAHSCPCAHLHQFMSLYPIAPLHPLLPLCSLALLFLLTPTCAPSIHLCPCNWPFKKNQNQNVSGHSEPLLPPNFSSLISSIQIFLLFLTFNYAHNFDIGCSNFSQGYIHPFNIIQIVHCVVCTLLNRILYLVSSCYKMFIHSVTKFFLTINFGCFTFHIN